MAEPAPIVRGLFLDRLAGLPEQTLHGLLVQFVTSDAVAAGLGATRRQPLRDTVGNQLRDGRYAPVMRAEHLREKDPYSDRGAINPGPIKNPSCFAERLVDSLFGKQGCKVQIIRLSGASNAAVQRTKF